MNSLRRHLRFVLFFGTMGGATLLLWHWLPFAQALLIGFDIGALVFIAALIVAMRDGNPGTMRQRAADNEPDHASLLSVAGVTVAIITVAIGVEVGGDRVDGVRLALTATTLLMAWLFGNFLFAVHYAHIYYLERGGTDRGGLTFPEDADPDYWDFAYFAFVLGMTFQVSDVQINDKGLRRIALLHGLIAFVFNICVIALTVSLVGSALLG